MPALLLPCLLLAGCSGVLDSATGGGTGSLQPDAKMGASLTKAPLTFPAGFMTSVKSYGAVGDGVTDDTAAIQRALADGRTDATMDYYGRPKALYFPAGIYLVRDTLQWIGCCVALQGAGPTSSILRLAPGSAGFANASQPKPVILTPAPNKNESFRQNIWDLGVSIAPGNPGATAISYVSNNNGSIHNAAVLSEDGKAHVGIDLTRQYAGPLLIRNTAVLGFDVGIDLANAEYSTTLEAVTLQNQNVAGIRNSNQVLNIRGLNSTNRVPAITNTGGTLVLLNGTLTGGSSANSAIQTNNVAYLRGVSSTGYKYTASSTLSGFQANVPGTITEKIIGSSTSLFGNAAQGSLKLDVEETPSFVSSSLSDWAPFVPRWYGDTTGLQAVLNGGTHTVYFPFQPYFSWAETQVTVPDTVDRIVGFSSIVNGSSDGPNGGGIRLVITSNSTTPLVVEQFGYGLKIDHRGTRPVVIKDGWYQYVSSPGAGNLFLEDAEIDGFAIQPGQHVWARQLNDEVNGTKIANQGGSLWILGLKTEQGGTVIQTTAAGQTELLGALIYPATAVSPSDVAFKSTDSQTSYLYRESNYCSSCGYSIQVQDTRAGKTKQLTSSPNQGWQSPLVLETQP